MIVRLTDFPANVVAFRCKECVTSALIMIGWSSLPSKTLFGRMTKSVSARKSTRILPASMPVRCGKTSRSEWKASREWICTA